MTPDPWYKQTLSVRALFSAADIASIRVVPWGTKPPLERPGVYVVALTDDPTRADVTHTNARISDDALEHLLTICRDLTVDGEPAVLETLKERLEEC
jgi:hypothetical protein